MKPRLVLLTVAVLILTALVCIRHSSDRTNGWGASRSTPYIGGSKVERLALQPLASPPSPSAATEQPSHLADALNSASGDIHADLRILNAVFEAFRSGTRGADPVGENREITAALTGRNSIEFSFIPPNHPAINPKGELCDRWGTPFFFHQLSGEQMEIRSAGPDRKLWTGDDAVLTPGLTAPPR